MIEILPFFPICFITGVVCAGIRRDSVRDMLIQGARFLVVFTLGCAVFGALSYLVCGLLT